MNSIKLLNQKMAQLLFLFPKPVICTPVQLSGDFRTISIYVILNILFISTAFAQTRGDLPSRILKLVPQGTELSSQNFTTSPTIAIAEFTASKSVVIGRSVVYSLLIRAFDNSNATWKMRESAYRKQMEDRIETHRSGLAPESANLGMFTADPVKETKNGWGTGLTQRILNHPPNAGQYVDYNCAYFGMVGGIVFELFVSGVPDSPDAADNWAQKVAELASELTVSNIGN
jgi:hypothetical protein